MVEEIWSRAFKLEKIKKDDLLSWEPLRFCGFFDIWNNPMYYQLRQEPKLYSIFSQLLRNPFLTVGKIIINKTIEEF